MRFLRFFRRKPLPDNPLRALLVSGDGEDSSFLTLTEKQARVCRLALWYARSNDFPAFGEEMLDFDETLAFLHRRLSPQWADDSARLIAELDQARAALDEADGKGQFS